MHNFRPWSSRNIFIDGSLTPQDTESQDRTTWSPLRPWALLLCWEIEPTPTQEHKCRWRRRRKRESAGFK